MLRLRCLLIPCAFILLAGCRGEDRTAREYAAKLNTVLKSYQSEVNRKIQAEEASYGELAEIYARAADEDIKGNLALEREERTERIVDQMLKRGAKNPLAPSELKTLLKDYGSHDFDQTREILEREAAATDAYLADLESLEIDAKKVNALAASLDELSKPKSRAQQLKDLAAFAENVDTEYNRLVCGDIADEIKRLSAQLDELKAEPDSDATASLIKRLKKRVDALKQKAEDLKCAN